MKSLLRGDSCTSPVPLLDHSCSVVKSAIADWFVVPKGKFFSPSKEVYITSGPWTGASHRVMNLLEVPLNWFSTFVFRRELTYRRKSATWHKFGMVWLYPSPIPMGKRKILLVQMITTCLRSAYRKGGSAPCGANPQVAPLIILCVSQHRWLAAYGH
jgi:hypothetical protein